MGVALVPFSVVFLVALSLSFVSVLFFFRCLITTSLALACPVPVVLRNACLAHVAADPTLPPFLGLGQVAY